jgi:glycosyltransferase involved in cell wall biosynthesis
MADAVAAILEDADLRNGLSQGARKIVIQEFSVTAVGDHLERAYLGISGGATT